MLSPIQDLTFLLNAAIFCSFLRSAGRALKSDIPLQRKPVLVWLRKGCVTIQNPEQVRQKTKWNQTNCSAEPNIQQKLAVFAKHKQYDREKSPHIMLLLKFVSALVYGIKIRADRILHDRKVWVFHPIEDRGQRTEDRGFFPKENFTRYHVVKLVEHWGQQSLLKFRVPRFDPTGG